MLLLDLLSQGLFGVSKNPLRKWSPVPNHSTLDKMDQGDFWRPDEFGATLKIASILRGRDIPDNVGSIFAGCPFLLVRFLLDKQKKMNETIMNTHTSKKLL